MDKISSPTRLVRFQAFEFDRQTLELRKHGLKIKLSGQPMEVLSMLLARPGELIAREELQQRLWPNDTIVEFEHSINAAVNTLRRALGDSADEPRYVETLTRRGYRFIAPLETTASLSSPAAERRSEATAAEARGTRRMPRRFWIIAVPLMVAIGAGILLVVSVARLRERVLRSVGAVREPPLQIRSLAVLPLENLSGDPGQEYFADGMTDELITELGKVSALRVISRNSVMLYKGKRKSTPEIARELNVDAVVEGAVMRSGERVRITAQLIQGRTDRHLWAESYERDLRDILALQSEVARAIAEEIRIKSTPQERARMASRGSVDPEAYDAYMKGQRAMEPRTYDTAIKYFQQAIEKDPNFAIAYAALAGA